MLRKVAIIISLIGFNTLGALGQSMPKEYWKEIADHSKLIIVGTVEEDYRVIRPEKYQLNPDGSAPTEREIYVGRVFRVKIAETLKGKIKSKKNGENKYTNVFLYWVTGVPAMGDPILFKGEEYVLFLKPNNDKELEGKETVEFIPNKKAIRKPFDNKSSYLVVDGFSGAVTIKNNKIKLIKEIKRAI